MMIQRVLTIIALFSLGAAKIPSSELPAEQLDSLFEEACRVARDGKGPSIDKETKLFFWGRYKIITGASNDVKDSEEHASEKRAYMSSIVGLSREQALREYLHRMDELRPDWRK
jgi:hypothetical protein